MRWFIFFIVFSGTANAITAKQLVEKYGKREITTFILEKTKGKLSILKDGQIRKAHMPSLDYVNSMTINMDLAGIGLTPNQVDKLFSEKQREKEKVVRIQKEEKLKKEHRRIVREAKEAKWLADDKLRKRDKFDLEVERIARESKNRKNSVYNNKSSKDIGRDCGKDGNCLSERTKREWYQGGNLHRATAKKWSESTYKNKLATAGDWFVNITKAHNLSLKSKLDSLSKPQYLIALKKFAEQLEKCTSDTIALESKGRKVSKPSDKAAEFASICYLSMYGAK